MMRRWNKSSSSSKSWSTFESSGLSHDEYNRPKKLVMVKVAVDSKARAEVMQITDIFRAKIVDVQPQGA